MKTYLPKINLDERKWHVIDADGAVLGRLAAQVADILRGKNKPIYTPHLDAGDFVVVINAEKVILTGKKETGKLFMSYSGWKGGEKYRSVAQIRARHPEKLITHAVRGTRSEICRSETQRDPSPVISAATDDARTEPAKP